MSMRSTLMPSHNMTVLVLVFLHSAVLFTNSAHIVCIVHLKIAQSVCCLAINQHTIVLFKNGC